MPHPKRTFGGGGRLSPLLRLLLMLFQLRQLAFHTGHLLLGRRRLLLCYAQVSVQLSFAPLLRLLVLFLLLESQL